MCLNMLSFWNFWNPAIFFFLVKKFKTDRQKHLTDRNQWPHKTLQKKDAQNVMKHALVLEFFKIKWCVYLAYFRSYGLFKISKYIEMYLKLMFETDTTPWKMHLLPSDLADRCFRVFCRWVILGGWPGGVPRKKKLLRICWNMFLFWNFWNPTTFFASGGGGGGGQKIKVVQNVLKHALVLEFLKSSKIFEKV